VASPTIPAPSRWNALREIAAVGELPRLALASRRLARLPRGGGAPVLVLPGFGAGDASTWALRTYLRRLGYAVHGWGIGRNGGDVPTLVPQVEGRTMEIARASGRAVRLVGWSLGGVLGRETARRRPDAVARVVTLAAAHYRRQGVDLDRLEREIAELDAVPIPVPVTAIYSRHDGVVAWQACIDRVNPCVEHVEVRTAHAGFGFSAEVYAILADRLAIGLEQDAGPGVSPGRRRRGRGRRG
jgi:pimeloyl-ACP methyl ester carboxylesterase